MILALIPIYLLFKLVYNKSDKHLKYKWEEDCNLDEDLGTYWESISGSEQKVMYATEVYYRNNFGIKAYTDEAFEKLRTTKNRGFTKVITSTPSYYIFDNKFYQDHLQYIPMHYRDEDIDHNISDPCAEAIFTSDHQKIPGVAKKDTPVIKTIFKDLKEQKKKKAERMKKLMELKKGQQGVNQ